MATAPTEHIVLADCKDGSNVLQSQMAYFNASSPSSRPQDTAVVPATDGQLATWFCDFTWGQFTTTGVKFNATLGQKRSEGDYIGTKTLFFLVNLDATFSSVFTMTPALPLTLETQSIADS